MAIYVSPSLGTWEAWCLEHSILHLCISVSGLSTYLLHRTDGAYEIFRLVKFKTFRMSFE